MNTHKIMHFRTIYINGDKLDLVITARPDGLAFTFHAGTICAATFDSYTKASCYLMDFLLGLEANENKWLASVGLSNLSMKLNNRHIMAKN